ncbi:helix-turn-helix domain-containing protein [Cytobacillus sp. Hm23]
MIKSNLAVLMAQRGLNITALSNETGITRNTISALYNNQAKGVQFETLTKLCDFFDVDVSEILTKIKVRISFENVSMIADNDYHVETTISIQSTEATGTIVVHTNGTERN